MFQNRGSRVRGRCPVRASRGAGCEECRCRRLESHGRRDPEDGGVLGSGFDFAIGQAPNPNLPGPSSSTRPTRARSTSRRPASKMDRMRMQGENPPHGGGQQPIIGVQPQNQTIIVNADTPWVQQLEIWMMPHGFLRAAAARNATAACQDRGRQEDDRRHLHGREQGQGQRLHQRSESRRDASKPGSTTRCSATCCSRRSTADYKDFGGVKFPMKIVQRQGGYPILDLTVSDVKPNAAVHDSAGAGPGRSAGRRGAGRRSRHADGEARRRRLSHPRRLRQRRRRLQRRHRRSSRDRPERCSAAEQIIAEAKRLIPEQADQLRGEHASATSTTRAGCARSLPKARPS